ncbi:MAG TPA: hypothetical protein VNY05_37580 [Candidatus Acidoferrales bacterium]|jgi:hypothetical protein|nr:hypothetical protein [Candidatus Acidoferrales bacterium]
MLRKTEEAPNETADLAQQHQALGADHQERQRLTAAVAATTAALESARATLAGMINDPLGAATTSDAEVQAAKRALVAAIKAGTASAEALSAHEALTGSLDARLAELSIRQNLMEQARAQAAHKDIVARKLKAGLELEALELEEHLLLKATYQRWPTDDGVIRAGAGIPVLTFAPGTFIPYSIFSGHVARCAFRDDFVKLALISYPDLASLLPADQQTAMQEKIDADYTRGTIHMATPGGWRIVEHHGLRGAALAAGNIRRDARGI